MKNKIIGLIFFSFFVLQPVFSAESLENIRSVNQGTSNSRLDTSLLTGKWTYRSYRNDPSLVDGDANKALQSIFGEGVFTFEILQNNTLKGIFDMGGGYELDLKGVVQPTIQNGAPLTASIDGYGRKGTPTDGWEYDYHGFLAYQWPNGSDQVPSLVGSVIRAKPHGTAKAGYVASFIAIKQP